MYVYISVLPTIQAMAMYTIVLITIATKVPFGIEC